MQTKVTVAKLNIDENPQTPMKYGVRGIPTLIMFKNGQVAGMKIGALPKSKLIEWVRIGSLTYAILLILDRLRRGCGGPRSPRAVRENGLTAYQSY